MVTRSEHIPRIQEAQATAYHALVRARGVPARERSLPLARPWPRRGGHACGWSGTVQGVGFRPYVYRLAREHGLAGFVRNDSRGVLLEVEGTQESVAGFLERLAREPPPLALVERVIADDRPPRHEHLLRSSTAPARASPTPR